MMMLSSLHSISSPLSTMTGEAAPSSVPLEAARVMESRLLSGRRTLWLRLAPFVLRSPRALFGVVRRRDALAAEWDEVEEEEDRVFNIFQVTNYHVIAKLATDQYGRKRCKVNLVDSRGNSISQDAKLVGFGAAYGFAMLKVDVEGTEVKPIVIGTSSDLRVGQSCFAIGNPYGYANTLTTGGVSRIGRKIPSPNGGAICGAIQTDAAINSGNSAGPLIDSYGHVIGVNTQLSRAKVVLHTGSAKGRYEESESNERKRLL